MPRLPPHPKRIHVLGFDDGPFDRDATGPVPLAGVFCRGTRFDGMLWREVRKDGDDATRTVLEMTRAGPYLEQVHLLLFDGVAFGGLNLLDLPAIAGELDRPAIAVMRRPPDLEAMRRAIQNLPDASRRLELLARAGPIHTVGPFTFQPHGLAPDAAHAALARLTDRGHVPEALRLAHLITSAVTDGHSRGRA